MKTLNPTGAFLLSAGLPLPALDLATRAVSLSTSLLSPDHPDTLTARNGLARSYWSAGRTGEAIAIQERLAADFERILGPDHPDTLAAQAGLAMAKETERDEKSPRNSRGQALGLGIARRRVRALPLAAAIAAAAVAAGLIRRVLQGR